MKFKKIFITLPVATVGAGLLATVLTSCNTNSVDDDKKVTLNDNGDLAKSFVNGKTYTFQNAVKMALTRSTSWATFKQALAEEIVLKWYEDRMYEDKDGKKERNKTFKSNYDEWKYQINKDYDSLVQSQKTKYGSNYKFYLQNEYLSQYGGTEESYKHAKLVEKVKTEFINNVFKFNYFGTATIPSDSEAAKAYPQIFVPNASTTISREELNQPKNWDNLGFYASVNPSFSMKTWPKAIGDITDEVVNFLAKNPDGDYATIQNYVFDRYFDTEKPFFSAASLFKYSKPHGIEEGDKLSVIYNTADTAVKLPDEPNESFPFFGGAEPTDASKGTRMYMEWFNAFNNGDFATKNGDLLSNGTISISNTASGGKGKYSEDSQTLLLASAVQMLGGTDSLYVPYATAAAQMYQNMLLKSPVSNSKMNYTSYDYIKSTIPVDVFEAVKNNNPAIFKNFFFDPTQYQAFVAAKGALNSFLYLPSVYPDGLTGDGTTAATAYEYHCPLFKNVKNFKYFYGDDTQTETVTITNPFTKKTEIWKKSSGIIFVTNTMYVDIFAPKHESVAGKINGQPWALQLNQSGMHAQTIDGYDYIVNHETTYGIKNITKSQAAKQVFKYRLMQKRTEQIDFMSGDLLGSSGKLKTYFTNNFADIILEMAQDTTNYTNVFRNIETFKGTMPEATNEKYFFNKLVAEQKFDRNSLMKYLEAVGIYDKTKKNLETIEKINSYIYEYRSKVITTAKSTTLMKTIYGNGLLAPLTYEYDQMLDNSSNHDYRECNVVADITFSNSSEPEIAKRSYRDHLANTLKDIVNTDFVKNSSSADVKVNTDAAFSPQVTAAKNAMSNRYWFKSNIVDKVMYAFYGNKTGVANQIKMDTYEAYASKVVANDASVGGTDGWTKRLETAGMIEAITSTYEKSKVITGNVTYADVGAYNDGIDNFLAKIRKRYDDNLKYQKAINGEYADDAVSLELFKATLAYLSINNYENLYKTLNSKIGENEVALVAYINKINPWFEDQESKAYTKAVADAAGLYARYGFTPDVDNLFDQDGFAGGDAKAHAASKEASATYWNLIRGEGDYSLNALAGFTGIQSKTSNSFDSASGMQTAIFDKFALSTHGVTNIDTKTTYEGNQGAWFAFAGSLENDGKTLIHFNEITYEDPSTKEKKVFNVKQLIGEGKAEKDKTQRVLRLAKKIANYDSIDDLKTLAKSLADAYDGGSVFKQIGYGELTYQDANEMRIVMLNELPHFELNADGTLGNYIAGKHENCFDRITNFEAHTTTNLTSNQDYCFEDGKGNGYRAFIKQLNKADITEKRLHFNYDEATGNWTKANSENPLTAAEFLYILCSTAAETSVQSTVITQAIKTILKDDKLTVYDANLYNAFDSSWIKDWVKKPMGK